MHSAATAPSPCRERSCSLHHPLLECPNPLLEVGEISSGRCRSAGSCFSRCPPAHEPQIAQTQCDDQRECHDNEPGGGCAGGDYPRDSVAHCENSAHQE